MAREKSLFTVLEETPIEKEALIVEEGPQFELKTKPNWLESKKPEQFVQFLDEQMSRIPSAHHSGGNQSLMERSLFQWKRLNQYCSEAMRNDFDGVLDVEAVDKKRQDIERNMDALQGALDQLNEMKKTRRNQKRKMRRASDDEEMVKEATAPHFNGFSMVMTPFQRAIAGALINGVIAGGQDMEELWDKVSKKYNMDSREKLEILQIISDMGYPTFKDRLRVDEDEDPSEGLGEWIQNYQS